MRTLPLRVVLVFLVCFGAASMLADCVTTTYPANGANDVPRVSDTVTLKWQAVAGATSYDIYFGPPGACSVAPVATEVGTQWSPPPSLTENTTYEWNVKANGVAGTCTSSCKTFTTASCPTDAPTLIEPIWGEVQFGSVTLKWDPVTNAAAYDVYAGLDGDTPALIGTTTSTQKSVNIEPGRYVDWYVVAKAPSCAGVQSSAEMFNTSCPSTPASLQLPNNNATITPGTNILFKWSAVSGAASYDLKVSSNGGDSWDVIASDINTLTYSQSFNASGTYLWEVRANFNGACDPLYTEPRTFRTPATRVDTQAAHVLHQRRLRQQHRARAHAARGWGDEGSARALQVERDGECEGVPPLRAARGGVETHAHLDRQHVLQRQSR